MGWFPQGGSIIEVIYYISQSLIVVAVVVGLVQLWLMKKQLVQSQEQIKQNQEQIMQCQRQIADDHEERRRQTSIRMLGDWQSYSNSGMVFIARRLVKKLSPDSKKQLIRGEQFSIPNDLKYFAFAVICEKMNGCDNNCSKCKRVFENEKEESSQLTLSASIILRQTVVSYLNMFENIAAAYSHNVADQNMLSEQFKYLVTGSENYQAMINDFGVTEAFPCTISFLNSMLEKPNVGSSKLGRNDA